ncbi:MAG TPA: hypothetical protein VIH18_28200 [Candidatus Binatia bacterium]|jgi:hypothetical protein
MPVIRPFSRESIGARRLVGAFLFIFVFSLPLHFHSLTVPAKVAKECSCLQGTRTQMALGAPASAYASPVVAQSVVFQTNSPPSLEWSKLECVRGPPVPLSI